MLNEEKVGEYKLEYDSIFEWMYYTTKRFFSKKSNNKKYDMVVRILLYKGLSIYLTTNYYL
jgi:hypothetical protein